MPLVPAAGEARVSERQERARKIKPQYAQGALVAVAWARNQARGRVDRGDAARGGHPEPDRADPPGFDVPDFMAAGPRDVLVARSGARSGTRAAARARHLPATGATGTARVSTPPATRVLAALLLGVAVLAVVLFMATHVWD